VLAGFAEDLDHQVGEAVDDLGVVRKIRRGVDHAVNLDDAFNPAQIAEFQLEGGELLQTDEAGGFVAFFDRQVSPELAVDAGTIGPRRPLARQEDQLSGLDGVDVVGLRYTQGGEG